MIDPKKTYRTRDGREVRIYAVDGEAPWPVHGAYKHKEDAWRSCSWRRAGGITGSIRPSELDLIEVKPRIKREVWVNVYRYENRQVHWVAFDRRDAADDEFENRIACVKLVIDCEEGEGL